MVDQQQPIFDGSLPQDHEEQHALGYRILSSAFQGHKSKFESELRALKLQNEEQRERLTAMQKKNSTLEVELVESHQRSQQLAEENKELFKTVGSLRKQIGRLEHLKAAVLSSIQDNAEKEVEMGDTRGFMSDEYLQQATPLTSQAMGLGAPTGYSQAPTTPKIMQGGMTGGMGGGAPNPSPAAPPDGKAFFRQARSRLPQESFNQFLGSIKRLNNQQQTRDETLAEARQLFGPENMDLHSAFESLLNSQGVA
jgi:hypothetical protein